jgi:glutamyl-tRNA reductase
MVELIKLGKESPLEQRERFLSDIMDSDDKEGILLNTCNRVEWYSGKGSVPGEVALHLFRVVSGLESVIIGETAIVNQVKAAYNEAAKQTSLDKNLHKLFQTALSVGKKVRRETGISRGAMSHSQAAVNLLFQRIKNTEKLNITVIGVNALNEKIIRFLVDKGAKTIFIGNRTFEKAKILAEKYNSTALRFEHLSATLEKTDVLISATSAPHFIIKKESFPANRKMYILDLAVPRDVEPEIGNLPGVTLFDIETVEKHIRQNIKFRNEKLHHAEKIIHEEVDQFSKSQLQYNYA